MVLQKDEGPREDEGSSPVSQKAGGDKIRYWGRNFATIEKILPCTNIFPAK